MTIASSRELSLTLVALASAGLVAAGCSGSSGGSRPGAQGTTTGGVSPTSSGGRDPMGYDWSTGQPLTGTAAGDGVGALAATSSSDYLAAHAGRTVERVMGGKATTEGGFAGEVVGFAAGGDLLATADPTLPDAGDVWQRQPNGWRLAIDGTRGAAAVAATSSRQAWAFLGDALSGPAEVQRLDGNAAWKAGGVLPAPGAPSAAVVHAGEAWVGVGPEAGLFRGTDTFALVSAPFSKVPGASQRVSALLSCPGGLAVAVAAVDGSGVALGGELLLWDGAGWKPLATLSMEAPLALAWQDGTLYAGTSAGRLVFVDTATGLLVDEPGLPFNLGIRSLATPDDGTLLVGAEGMQGAEVFVRLARGRVGQSGAGSQPGAAPPPAGTTPPPAGGTPDYLRWAKPVLLSRCGACHSTMATGWRVSAGMTDDMGDYTVTKAQVDLAAPAMSRLLRKATNADPHAGGATLQASGAEYKQLLDWVTAGAQYMTAGGAAPPPPAIPANPLYLTDVKPILGTCIGCHTNKTDYKLSPNLANDTADYQATLRECNLTTPASSNFLRRATRAAGHPVKVFDVGSIPYETFLKWVQQGAKFQ